MNVRNVFHNFLLIQKVFSETIALDYLINVNLTNRYCRDNFQQLLCRVKHEHETKITNLWFAIYLKSTGCVALQRQSSIVINTVFLFEWISCMVLAN